MKKKTILFDLDGTLVDNSQGIKRCVRYALEKFGIEEENQEKLERFIGPPLIESFQREYGFSEEDAWKATEFYRERYRRKGILECELYSGVKETLKTLSAKECHIAVASSKPEEFCQKIIEYFQIERYFELIGGARMDGKISNKTDVLENVLKRLGTKNKDEVVLIGDTRFDAIGAQETGIDCIGVTYGFEQDIDTMRQAGAIYICDTLEEVVEYLEKQ